MSIRLGVLFCLVAITGESAATEYYVPKAIKEKYHNLYGLSPKTLPDGSVQFHQARLFNRRGIHVLSLKGDVFEMAYQHGKLLSKEIQQGAMPELATVIEKVVRNAMPQIPLITNQYIERTYKRVTETLMENSTKLVQAAGFKQNPLLAAYGLSEGSGLSLKQTLYAALAAESLAILTGEQGQHDGNAIAGDLSHCSAFAAWGKNTSDGEMIIGRNTDYSMNGFYDRFPTVIYFEPTDGGQRFMAVMSAGLHNAGVIGFNESGIYMGSHTVPTSLVSTNAVPVFFLAQEILANSKKLDDMVPFFKKFNSASGWSYSVVSTKEKKAATIEVAFGKVRERAIAAESFAQTNHFQHPEMVPDYFSVNRAVDDDTFARKERLEGLVSANQGRVDARMAMRFMGDKFDLKNKKVRAVGNTVAVHTTLSSAVFEPSKGRVFIGNGMAPVSQNEYVELPLVEFFDPEKFGRAAYEVVENADFKKEFPSEAAAEQLFIQSKIQFELRNNWTGARSLMTKAIEMDPENPHYRFVHAMYSLKMGDMASAQKMLKSIVETYDTHLRYLGKYFLARVRAHQGYTSEAYQMLKELSKEVSKEEEPKLSAAIVYSLQKVKGLKINTGRLVVLVQQADVLSYE